MNEFESNHGIKKMSSQMDQMTDCQSNHYPQPYAMTKLQNEKQEQQCLVSQMKMSPLKSVRIQIAIVNLIY